MRWAPQIVPSGPAAFLEKAEGSSHKGRAGKAFPHLLGGRSSNSLVGPTPRAVVRNGGLCVQSG